MSVCRQPAVHPETDVRLLDLNKIVNSTYNPRKNFREETLLELAESIKQSGVLQPICVRPRDEGFEDRLRRAPLLGGCDGGPAIHPGPYPGFRMPRPRMPPSRRTCSARTCGREGGRGL